MKFGKLVLSMSVTFLFVTPSFIIAGEASGGGGPAILLVSCPGSVHLSARKGQETTQISALVEDKELTEAALYLNKIGFSFTGNQVHFVDAKPGAPKDGFYLAVDTKTSNGVFLATLTVNKKFKEISCSILDNRFRPMAETKLNTEFRYGGNKCFEGGQCVGFASGPLSEKDIIPLVFNAKTGQLEGRRLIEKTVFDSTVVYEWVFTQERDKPLVQQYTVSLKENSNPTTLLLEGNQNNILLQTTALTIGKDTLSIWQRVRVY